MRQKWLTDVLECLEETQEDNESALDRGGRNRPNPEQWHVDWSDKVKIKEHLWQRVHTHPSTDSHRCSLSVSHQYTKSRRTKRDKPGECVASPGTGQLANCCGWGTEPEGTTETDPSAALRHATTEGFWWHRKAEKTSAEAARLHRVWDSYTPRSGLG